jgi:hypothetical protein
VELRLHELGVVEVFLVVGEHEDYFRPRLGLDFAFDLPDKARKIFSLASGIGGKNIVVDYEDFDGSAILFK